MINWLTYANQGATRNQPLSDRLTGALGSFLPEMGVTMKVFSGGQDAEGPRRTGSHRHDHGNAADVFFYKDGRQLSWANPDDLPVFEDIVRRGKAAGITGFGAGDGYMRPGSMHIGFGSPAVWGAGGQGSNAPGWLRSAYNGTGATDPQQVASIAPALPGPDGPKGQESYPSPAFGSIAPTQIADNATDPIAAKYAFGEKKTLGDRLGKLGQAFDDAIPAAPRPSAFPGGPSKEQANAIMAVLKNPSAFSQMLLGKRMA